MTRVSTAVVALTALLIFSAGAQAVPMYDFSSPQRRPRNRVGPGPNLTSATSRHPPFIWNGTIWEVSKLIARNVPNDHGLGNCSPDEICVQGTEVPAMATQRTVAVDEQRGDFADAARTTLPGVPLALVTRQQRRRPRRALKTALSTGATRTTSATLN